MDFAQIIQKRIRNLHDQKSFYIQSDIEYYHKHIVRLDERIKELNFCLDAYLNLDSE